MEYTDHVNMEEPRTCGNCDDKRDDCYMVDVGIVGPCASWKPIPVATTDAPELKTDVDWLKWTQQLKTAIAKRDDLIRKFIQHQDNIGKMGFRKWCNEDDTITADAKKLMEVK